jgi:hypothetical protein
VAIIDSGNSAISLPSSIIKAMERSSPNRQKLKSGAVSIYLIYHILCFVGGRCLSPNFPQNYMLGGRGCMLGIDDSGSNDLILGDVFFEKIFHRL